MGSLPELRDHAYINDKVSPTESKSPYTNSMDPISPLIHLSKSILSKQSHKERVEVLLEHILKFSQANHLWLWISWGEEWLPVQHVGEDSNLSIPMVLPEKEGHDHERLNWPKPFKDVLLCRQKGQMGTFLLVAASLHYDHCYGPKKIQMINKVLEFSMGHLENGLTKEWSMRYFRKLLPESFSHMNLPEENDGIVPPLEILEKKLNQSVEKLSLEKKNIQRQHDLWRTQVYEEMKNFDSLQSLGRLVASLAHEINNPNSFIKINVPVLRDLWNHYITPDPSQPISREFIEERVPVLLDLMGEGSQRIDQLIQDLKNYARQNHSELMETIDLRDVISSALRLNKKYIEHHTRHFSMNMPDHPILVHGISHRLEQVVVNLLQNACDALENTQQKIVLTIEEDSNRASLSVSDEGQGMDTDVLERIFEPLYTTKNEKKGLGMGMSIVKTIIDQHKASIDVCSTPGQGTTFIIRFYKTEPT